MKLSICLENTVSSTWEWKNGELKRLKQPLDSHPQLCNTSGEQINEIYDMDRNARSHEAEIVDQTHLRICLDVLDWRRTQMRRANCYLGPWSIETRLLCAKFPALLEEYYELEVQMAKRIRDRFMHYRTGAMDDALDDPTVVAEISKLLEVQNLRDDDAGAGNDTKTLKKVLINFEARLRRDIESKARSEACLSGPLVTQLSFRLLRIMWGNPELVAYFRSLREAETSEFPYRWEIVKRRVRWKMDAGRIGKCRKTIFGE